jgi:hypothetical protein
METVREILLAIEASVNSPHEWVEIHLSGRSEAEISYHVELLANAGLITATDASSFDGHEWHAKALTCQGHEFLEAIRDPEVWRRTKDGIKKASNYSIEFAWELAKLYGKQLLKERLGIDL